MLHITDTGLYWVFSLYTLCTTYNLNRYLYYYRYEEKVARDIEMMFRGRHGSKGILGNPKKTAKEMKGVMHSNLIAAPFVLAVLAWFTFSIG